jgi:hypothetical protein
MLSQKHPSQDQQQQGQANEQNALPVHRIPSFLFIRGAVWGQYNKKGRVLQ